MPRVLIAESNTLLAKYFNAIIEGVGYSVCGIAATTDQAADMVAETRPDMVLLEDVLPGRQDGVDLARNARECLDIPVVLITGEDGPGTSVRFKAAHPAAVLVKPVFAQTLWTALARHCA